jgi:hypothetical protein
MALSRCAMLVTHPGAWSWFSERGSECRVGRPSRGTRNGAGDSHRRSASCRARASFREFPSCPSSAAIACVISADELIRVSFV